MFQKAGLKRKVAAGRRWLAQELSRAALKIAPEPASCAPFHLTTDEMIKLAALARIDFQALGKGEVKARYRALDPMWDRHSQAPQAMIPLRDHMMRLCSVAEEYSNRGYSSDWRAVAESLHLGASLRDLSADTDVYGDNFMCSSAADFDEAHSEVAAKYLAGVIVFNLVWGAYEWAIEIVSGPVARKHGKGARGRDLVDRVIGDGHFPYLRMATFDALDLGRVKAAHFRSPEMRRLLTAGSLAGIGAEYLREFRNALVHGSLPKPEPEDWGEKSEYSADDDPDILQFHANTRLTLLLIQILMRSVSKEGDDLTAWFSDPTPAPLALTQLHCPLPGKGGLPFEDAPVLQWEDPYAIQQKYRWKHAA